MLELLTSPDAWISLATLSALEIVLGIDNVVFLTILAGRLPKEQQAEARRLGLGFALLTRLALLFAITWVMGLTRAALLGARPRRSPAATSSCSAGGLFLIGKATHEIHDKLEVEHAAERRPAGAAARRVLGGDRPDRPARHRLLARLGHHRGRHGAAPLGDGGGDGPRGRRDDGLRRARSASSWSATRPSRCWRSPSSS